MKISQKIKLVAASLAVVLSGAMVVAPAMAFSAAQDCPTGYTNENASSIAECFTSGKKEDNNLMGTLNTVLNVVFGVIGFVAVIMLVYGGIQYTISAGDAGKVKKAKDTILYGIVGLIIALLAAAIVNFVLAGVFKA